MTNSPSKIDLLPEHLIDQIKAGEVIERPGNLIKEILENSIDAGSTKITLTLKNNGLDLISLKDNGHGIRFGELPLAFSRHATSKITRFEDLYSLHSFGFRGEALASISAISKVQCISFTQEEPEGAELRIEGGLTTYHGKRSKNVEQLGTELIVQDLFFNTPARLKFIQTQTAEKSFIKRIIFSFIFAHPQIEFIIQLDDEEKDIYPARDSLRERITDLNTKCEDAILYTRKQYEEINFELFLVPSEYKLPLKFQFVFINDRFVLDKQILRVLSNSLLSTFGRDDFQIIAKINLPTDHIDVNVHPNKTIIKMFETSKVIGLITGSIKELAQSRQSAPLVAKSEEKQVSLEGLQLEKPTLEQERHSYNFEGHFSPHKINEQQDSKFIWISPFILIQFNNKWEAFHSGKLLDYYIQDKLKLSLFQSIPLLVSEPFEVAPSDEKRISFLNESGIELERLSGKVFALRTIPHWMSGFPLKDILQRLIKNESLTSLEINQEDWAQSTVLEMINDIGIENLRLQKICVDLKMILMDKF